MLVNSSWVDLSQDLNQSNLDLCVSWPDLLWIASGGTIVSADQFPSKPLSKNIQREKEKKLGIETILIMSIFRLTILLFWYETNLNSLFQHDVIQVIKHYSKMFAKR